MPLYDLSYRRLRGPRTARWRRAIALARSAIGRLLERRSFLLLVALCWIPVIARAVQIYVTRQFPQAPDLFSVSASTWREFLAQQVQLLPVVLVTLYAGAGAIASDFASGAFVVYLSKPISRFDYLLGKAIPIVAAICAVTLVPALALLALHLALSPDLDLLARSPWLPVSIAGYSLWLSLYFSLSVLAVSSLCRSGRIAGAGFAALAFGSQIVVAAVVQRPPPHLSMMGAAVDASHWFFACAASGHSALASLVSMAIVMAISAAVLEQRLRSREAAL